MAQVPAEIINSILRETSVREAILLRGTASILDGLPQNDIDIFIPRHAWNSATGFGRHRVVSVRRSGLKQKKVSVQEADSGILVDVDVFHQITWRGLIIVDAQTLPTRKVDSLGVVCLSTEAEAWLTVTKNILHGSPTPPEKLKADIGTPAFSTCVGPVGGIAERLSQRLTAAAWAGAVQHPVDRAEVWRARLALVGLRVKEDPLGTLAGLGRWAAWRIGSRRNHA